MAASNIETQTLLLGLGGTGSRIVNHVAEELKSKNIGINDGTVCCAVLDTNDSDRSKLLEKGSTIPVIGTSKVRSIANYMRMYAGSGVDEWMPVSHELLTKDMKDGASQMRAKSRLAFMDTIEDHSIQQLESHIDKLFDKRTDAKIRVMIVSSLAGGTGSGMFIQAALWVRKYFEKRKCQVNIRGIFILPDVFVSTLKDMRSDSTEMQSLYANAYGAVRELNAITKIKTKGLKPLSPIKIDSLFDSEKGQPDGNPVFDYAFFIDAISEGGSVMTSIEEYEKVAARLVYMQLYAPMVTPLYSEEDNLFKRFQQSPEPVFGSCGAAKAVYPGEDVLRYCALRAAKEAISSGWRRLDLVIQEKQRKEEEKEQNGAILSRRISPRAEYVRLFDAETAKSGDQVGRDRLFANIATDVKNEERITGQDGLVEIRHTDKVGDFLQNLDRLISEMVDTYNPGQLASIYLGDGWAEDNSDDRDTLKEMVDSMSRAVERFIREMDDEKDNLAEELLDRIFTTDMGDVNQENSDSIVGLLTKKDKNGETFFVHPIAVRYLLYKLMIHLDELKGNINVNNLRNDAIKGSDVEFDNSRTSSVEESPESYLGSKGFLQSEAKFLATFRTLYAEHNEKQAHECRCYAVGVLKLSLLTMITKRLEKLVNGVESFFRELGNVSDKLNEELAENIRKNTEIQQKVVFVCASEEEKNVLYSDLHMDTGNSDTAVNRIIVNALYGQFCAQENKSAANNKQFVGKNISQIFKDELIRTYSYTIRAKRGEDIDMDIYAAVCRSSDIAYEKAQQAKADLGLGQVREETGEERHRRHLQAMQVLTDSLAKLGAPFLIFDEDVEETESFGDDEYRETANRTPIRKRKTYWGIHPQTAENCKELAQILGVSLDSHSDGAYSKNELDYYSAVYGIQAGAIEKFNEQKDGDYYKSYRQIVNRMIRAVASGDTDELIHTPHLDKTWHLSLPYVTTAKQEEEDNKFYRLLWLSLAYGNLYLDKDGKYQIKRYKNVLGKVVTESEPVLYQGKSVGKVDVMTLLAALKLDGSFMLDAVRLEDKFAEDCEKQSYEGTAFLRGEVKNQSQVGGLASKLETNAVTMIVRYNNCPGHSTMTTYALTLSLQAICAQLIAGHYERNETEKVEQKAVELCKRIYNASTLKDKAIEAFEAWDAKESSDEESED